MTVRFSNCLDTMPDVSEPYVADWTGRFRLGRSQALRLANDEQDLQAIVRVAPGAIRVIGSKLSQPALLRCELENSQLIDLSRFEGTLAIEADNITFAAATTLEAVHSTLASLNRMLPCCPGVISRQSLAGALATGTHGQGLQQSSFADTVIRFRMVLADGSIRTVDEEDVWFRSAQLSLGSLGIVTAITMRTVPARVFTCLKRTLSDDDLETMVHAWADAEPYSKAWWFPEDGRVHLWLGRAASPEEIASYAANGRSAVALSGKDNSLNDTIDKAIQQLRHDTKDHDEAGDQFHTLRRFRDVSDTVGDLFQLFCNGVAAPQVNLEIAIPLRRVGEAVHQLRLWHNEVKPQLHYPVILRCTGPSRAWLSPTAEEPACYFGFVVYYAEDGSISENGLTYLRGVEQVLAAMGGRPHWAKHFNPSLYDWSRLYPHWYDFLAVRAEADPTAKFANVFIRDLFGIRS